MNSSLEDSLNSQQKCDAQSCVIDIAETNTLVDVAGKHIASAR
jgi:hypothetical protein